MTHYLSILEETFRKNWNNKALCNYAGDEFTFRDVAVSIEKFHIFFEKIGIKKGDHISICAKNTARWAISFFTVNTYEAVAVPILNDFLPDSINHLVDHSESVVLFTDREIWDKLDLSGMPMLKAAICTNDFSLLYGRDEEITAAFSSVSDEFSRKYPLGFNGECVSFPTGNNKDIAVINYTSGTTSAPKGVMLRYECFSAMINFSIQNVKVSEKDNMVSILPMGHIYGLVIELLFPLCFGCTIYFLGKTPSPTLLIKAMKEVKPFMVASVPLVLEKVYKSSLKPVLSKWNMRILLHIPFINNMIYDKIGRKFQEAFGGNVRHFILGGAAMNPEVEKVFKKIHLPYTVGYGMTEASPLLTYANSKEYVIGSCGKAVACTELRIDSEDPMHIVGEIQARGTNICSGYFKNEEATANAFTEDGFLRTGDLGIIDKDGNIFIRGRSKNMILSANGQNIYPEEVEAVVNNQDYIAESVVVERASKLVAIVYLDKDAIKRDKLDDEAISDLPERVMANANKCLPSYSKITKMEIVLEPFEKTPKMSIKRFLYK